MCAWRQTARGGVPSATLAARHLRVGLAALLVQSARGGDPRTPRGRKAHQLLGLAPLLRDRAEAARGAFPASTDCHLKAAADERHSLRRNERASTRSGKVTRDHIEHGGPGAGWPMGHLPLGPTVQDALECRVQGRFAAGQAGERPARPAGQPGCHSSHPARLASLTFLSVFAKSLHALCST